METEEFVSGFCKKQNQMRSVICIFEETEDGKRKLIEADCMYGKCEHSKYCTLMGQVL